MSWDRETIVDQVKNLLVGALILGVGIPLIFGMLKLAVGYPREALLTVYVVLMLLCSWAIGMAARDAWRIA